MNGFKTIQTRLQRGVCFIKLNRPEAKNSVNGVLVEELLSLFYQLEQDSTIKVLVLEGNDQHFCTGMDFNAVNEGGGQAVMAEDNNGHYNMLKHMEAAKRGKLIL